MPPTRTVARFAWLPTRLTDGTWCHLAWYAAHEEFTACDDPEPWGSLAPAWRTRRRERITLERPHEGPH